MYISSKIKIIDDTKEKEHFFCNHCSFPLKSFEDFNYHKEWNVCHQCYLNFVEGRKSEWKEGWRPSKKEFKEYINYIKSIK